MSALVRRRRDTDGIVDDAKKWTKAFAVVMGSWLLLGFLVSLLSSVLPVTILEGPYFMWAHVLICLIILGLSPRGFVITVGLALRSAVVHVDLNLRANLTFLPRAADSEFYYTNARMVAMDYTLLGADLYGGLFTKLAGLLMGFTGMDRGVVQYTNSVLAVGAIVLLCASLAAIGAKQRLLAVLAVGVFFPYPLLFSSLFLRESVIVFAVSVAAAMFMLWLRFGGSWRLALLIGAVLAGALFHAGVVALLIPIALVVSAYDRRRRRLVFSVRSAFVLTVLCIMIGGVLVAAPDLFLGKFQLNQSDAVETAINYRDGSSSYLTSVSVDGPQEVLLWGPVRAFYLMFSPLPMDWRSIGDAMAFLVDSLFYATVLVQVARRGLRETAITWFVVLGVAAMAFVFGLGTGNSGTAIRHRAKILPLLLVAMGLLNTARHRQESGTWSPPVRGERAAGETLLSTLRLR